jgi:poly-gamma-glutamate capsule biosynthesis protein CapA/YwtB (metallophosphatase superfamily)
MNLLLAGDVMTGRSIDQVLPHPLDDTLHEPYVQSGLEYVTIAEKANGPIPKPVDFHYVWGDAIEEFDRVAPAARIINLETSVTTQKTYEPKGINYRMHPANLPCLKAAKIDCCTLANNHVLDYGRPGLAETTATLQRAGIQTTGAGINLDEALKPAIIETGRNSRIIILAVGIADSGIPSSWAATDTQAGVAWLPNLSSKTAACLAERVRALRRPNDLIILSVHWGENWGYQIPTEQQAFAHTFLDLAGGDVIYGHSSHHPKAIEVYRNKLILYGCGDFLDDYEGIMGYEEFRSHIVLAYFLTLDPSMGSLFHLKLTPFVIKRFRLHRAGSLEAGWMRDLLNREGKSFGTRAVLDAGNRLSLEWQN